MMSGRSEVLLCRCAQQCILLNEMLISVWTQKVPYLNAPQAYPHFFLYSLQIDKQKLLFIPEETAAGVLRNGKAQ